MTAANQSRVGFRRCKSEDEAEAGQLLAQTLSPAHTGRKLHTALRTAAGVVGKRRNYARISKAHPMMGEALSLLSMVDNGKVDQASFASPSAARRYVNNACYL